MKITPKARPEQFADAFECVARVNHYMVGIVEKGSWEELCAAQQVLITRQNRVVDPERRGKRRYKHYDLALDLVEQALRRIISHKMLSPVS